MNKLDASITIERLSQANVSDLPALYHKVYGRKTQDGYFAKKYGMEYNSLAYVGYIAYGAEHMPIAFIGAVPRGLPYNGKTVLAAQLTDGMTDPASRNKGLFVNLVEQIIRLCKQKDVGFLFGFPNQNSLPVLLNKLGWDIYGKMDLFNLPVHAIPLEKISRKFSVVKNLYRSYVNNILKKYTPHATISYPGTFLISIWEARILVRIHNGLSIGEMRVSENEFADVMRVLNGIAKKLGVDKIVFHCSTGSELHRLFAESYTAIPSFTIVCKDLGSGIPMNALQFNYADIDIF